LFNRLLFVFLNRVAHNPNRSRSQRTTTSNITTLSAYITPNKYETILWEDGERGLQFHSIKEFASHERINAILSIQSNKFFPKEDELTYFFQAIDVLDAVIRNTTATWKNISSVLSGQGFPKTPEELTSFTKALNTLAQFAVKNNIKFSHISSILGKQGLPETLEELTSSIEALNTLAQFAVENNIEFSNISSILSVQGLPKTGQELTNFTEALAVLARFADENEGIDFSNISSILNGQGLPQTPEELTNFTKTLNILAQFTTENDIDFSSISHILFRQGLPKTEQELTNFTEALGVLARFVDENEGIDFSNISPILNKQGLPKTPEELTSSIEALNTLAQFAVENNIEFKRISSILSGQGLPKTPEELKKLMDTLTSLVITTKEYNIDFSSVSKLLHSRRSLNKEVLDDVYEYINSLKIAHSVLEQRHIQDVSIDNTLGVLWRMKIISIDTIGATMQEVSGLLENNFMDTLQVAENIDEYKDLFEEYNNGKIFSLTLASKILKASPFAVFLAYRILGRNMRSLRRVLSGKMLSDGVMDSKTRISLDAPYSANSSRTAYDHMGEEDVNYQMVEILQSVKHIADTSDSLSDKEKGVLKRIVRRGTLEDSDYVKIGSICKNIRN